MIAAPTLDIVFKDGSTDSSYRRAPRRAVPGGIADNQIGSRVKIRPIVDCVCFVYLTNRNRRFFVPQPGEFGL